jgi:integrase/recombinase XerD
LKLSRAIAGYVEWKRGQGIQFVHGEQILRAFIRSSGDRQLSDVTARHVSNYLDRSKMAPDTCHRAHHTVHSFFQFWMSRKRINQLPMPPARAARPPLFRPYIFTQTEMRRLLRAIESHRLSRAIDPQTLKALVLFLFGSGALIHEALNLMMDDLDLSRSVVTLRRAHSGRVRTIPIGPNLCRALKTLVRIRPSNQRLFQNREGGQIRRINLIRAFQRACLRSGIRTKTGSRLTPVLHELRNTFAVQCLERWVQRGVEIHKVIPVLSSYLGHVEPRSTERYLRFVPSRFTEPLRELTRINYPSARKLNFPSYLTTL